MNRTPEPRLEPIDYAIATKKPRRAALKILLVAGILLALLSIAWPSYFRWRNRYNPDRAARNLSHIGMGLLLYANDYGVYPPDFGTLLIKEDLSPDVFVDPNVNDTPAPGATAAAQGRNLMTMPGHCSYIYAAPNAATRPAMSDGVLAYERFTANSPGSDFLFGDGHVQFIGNPEANRLVAELNAGHNPPRPATTSGVAATQPMQRQR